MTDQDQASVVEATILGLTQCQVCRAFSNSCEDRWRLFGTGVKENTANLCGPCGLSWQRYPGDTSINMFREWRTKREGEIGDRIFAVFTNEKTTEELDDASSRQMSWMPSLANGSSARNANWQRPTCQMTTPDGTRR